MGKAGRDRGQRHHPRGARRVRPLHPHRRRARDRRLLGDAQPRGDQGGRQERARGPPGRGRGYPGERRMNVTTTTNDKGTRVDAMAARARAIRQAGGIDAAVADGSLTRLIDTTLSEGLVLGLLKQGVRKYLAIFGHGSTDLGEVLRIYEEEGVTRTFNCRNEVEMAHAATALRWQYGEIPAVVTSIGPGAMQAFAGSLASASNGVGLYHIYGDETTYGEGYNMQQVPKQEQHLFGQMTAIMGRSYVLHTPQALRDALRRGGMTVNHPYRAGPFYLLLPLNTQPAPLALNLSSLPARPEIPAMAPASDDEM